MFLSNPVDRILRAGGSAVVGSDGSVTITPPTGAAKVTIPTAVQGTANYGLFNLGDGGFGGGGAPAFAGIAGGTYFAINATSATPNLIDAQINGVRQFAVAQNGITVAQNIQLLQAAGSGSFANIFCEGQDILVQRRTTNVQEFRLYNTFSDGSNYSRLVLRARAGDTYQIFAEAAGTGTVQGISIQGSSASLQSSAGAINIGTIGANAVQFFTTNTNRWNIASGGNFAPNTDNALDIGDATHQVRSLYVGTSLVAGGTITKYSAVTTAGWGVPAVYAAARSLAQTAAVVSVATYTVGAADGSFLVSANVNITTFSSGSINATVAYTDESNTVRSLKLPFSALSGSFSPNASSAGPWSAVPCQIRCKAGTTITIATSGTFTSLTYNVEGFIAQIA